MNKKTVLTFLVGFIAAGLIFGMISLAQRSSARVSESQAMALDALPKATQPITVASKQTSTEPVQTTGSETAAFKSFLSSEPDAHSVIHEVKKGDTLTNELLE